MKKIDTFEFNNVNLYWTFALEMTEDEINRIIAYGHTTGNGLYQIDDLSPYAKNNGFIYIIWKASSHMGRKLFVNLKDYM